MNKLQLKAMLAGVSTDKTRPNICGVLFKRSRLNADTYKIELTSTDGHVLFHLTLEEKTENIIGEDFQPQSCVLPADILKLAIAAQKWKTTPVERQIKVSDDLKEIIVDDTLRFPFESTDYKFPKWENVMVEPTNNGYLGTIGVEVLKQVIEFSKIADSKIAGISFWLGKGKYHRRGKIGQTAYAIRICGLYPSDSAKIVVMPLRDENAETRYPDTEKCKTCKNLVPVVGSECMDITCDKPVCEWEPKQDHEPDPGEQKENQDFAHDEDNEPIAIINNHDA